MVETADIHGWKKRKKANALEREINNDIQRDYARSDRCIGWPIFVRSWLISKGDIYCRDKCCWKEEEKEKGIGFKSLENVEKLNRTRRFIIVAATDPWSIPMEARRFWNSRAGTGSPGSWYFLVFFFILYRIERVLQSYLIYRCASRGPFRCARVRHEFPEEAWNEPYVCIVCLRKKKELWTCSRV